MIKDSAISTVDGNMVLKNNFHILGFFRIMDNSWGNKVRSSQVRTL